MGIRENLASVREKIYNSALKAGRNPVDIKLVAVTKSVRLQEIIEAVEEGISILGENRVQEAQKKSQEFRVMGHDRKVEWHLIGHLQKNKVKHAIQLFNLIHTIDSVELADEVNKQAERAGKVQRVLAQVKLSEETTKHGVAEKGLPELLDHITKMNNLDLEGLMTMAPYFEDAEKARLYFRKLRELKDKAVKSGITLNELSMGMSHDFEVAIEEGTTMVRIGTAIFGERT